MAIQEASVSLDMFKHRAKQWPHKQHQYHLTCLNTGLSIGHTSSISINLTCLNTGLKHWPQAASYHLTSLNTAKAVVTSSIMSLDMFKHRAKVVATQAASYHLTCLNTGSKQWPHKQRQYHCLFSRRDPPAQQYCTKVSSRL